MSNPIKSIDYVNFKIRVCDDHARTILYRPLDVRHMAAVLTEDEVEHFLAFGWVNIKQLLSPAETAELTAAYMAVAVDCDDSLLSGGGPGGPGGGGSRDRQRAEEASENPDASAVFQRMIGHPRLMAAMRQIDGTEFLYQGSQAHHRMPLDNPVWHCDHPPPHHLHNPVKVNFYLDQTFPNDGALE